MRRNVFSGRPRRDLTFSSLFTRTGELTANMVSSVKIGYQDSSSRAMLIASLVFRLSVQVNVSLPSYPFPTDKAGVAAHQKFFEDSLFAANTFVAVYRHGDRSFVHLLSALVFPRPSPLSDRLLSRLFP